MENTDVISYESLVDAYPDLNDHERIMKMHNERWNIAQQDIKKEQNTDIKDKYFYIDKDNCLCIVFSEQNSYIFNNVKINKMLSDILAMINKHNITIIKLRYDSIFYNYIDDVCIQWIVDFICFIRCFSNIDTIIGVISTRFISLYCMYIMFQCDKILVETDHLYIADHIANNNPSSVSRYSYQAWHADILRNTILQLGEQGFLDDDRVQELLKEDPIYLSEKLNIP